MLQNNLVIIIMDSCRYDTFVRAKTPNMESIGGVDKRWSYASWTAPSHYAFLMGLMPHSSPTNVYASEVYKEEFVSWESRLGIDDMSFKTFLPEISLPKVLSGLDYETVARVSMPVLNNFTILNQHFDDYRLMANHNDFAGMVDEIDFSKDKPQFYFLNLGETHYPYMLDSEDLPHISGVHGVFKSLAASNAEAPGRPKLDETQPSFFDLKTMRRLHDQQVECVEYIDKSLEKLFNKAPENTYFIITSDHGELFGEGGYFGHGPIMHEKCFEIPYLEGRLP